VVSSGKVVAESGRRNFTSRQKTGFFEVPKKNKSTSQSGAWTVCLNGNRVGEISKAQHTSTCQTARNDHQLAIRQGFNYCMMVCNAILASLGTTLLLLFSVVIALTISESEQTYSLLIEFFQKSTAADLSYFAKNLLSMILVVSMTYWQ